MPKPSEISSYLPYPMFLSLYYAWYRLRDLTRIQILRRQLGIKLLSHLDLTNFKRSEMLVILGSGPSVNEITSEQWNFFSKQDSIGLNFWLFHSFVPRIYAFEGITLKTPEMFNAFKRISTERAADYKGVLKIVTVLAPNLACPQEWMKDLHTFYPIPIPARNDRELRIGLRRLQAEGLFNRNSGIKYLYKQASSLSWCIALAIVLGYKKIVLCGIDLNDSRCFYQDPHLYPASCQLEFFPQNAPHATNVKMPWHLPITRVIEMMNKELLIPRGIQLYVANRRSALWPGLPELSHDFSTE